MFLSSFSLPPVYLWVGGVLGFVLGLVAAGILSGWGLFKRRNRLHDFLAKFFYLYVVLLFVVCCAALAGFQGLRGQVKSDFRDLEPGLKRAATEAGSKAVRGLGEALGGKPLETELMSEAALLVTNFTMEELDYVLPGSTPVLAESYKKARGDVRKIMAGDLTREFDKAGKGKKTITMEELDKLARDTFESALGDSWLEDSVLDPMLSEFRPFFFKVFWWGFLFFLLIFPEPVCYFTYRFVRGTFAEKRKTIRTKSREPDLIPDAKESVAAEKD
ncbi:MAG: hypothetical protein LBF41_04505 [Deltaproteobacteria bacterium]|jgi:hypothetical protein|nr:hypothetical protein [Deltaproteobacteria bacterium]